MTAESLNSLSTGMAVLMAGMLLMIVVTFIVAHVLGLMGIGEGTPYTKMSPERERQILEKQAKNRGGFPELFFVATFVFVIISAAIYMQG